MKFQDPSNWEMLYFCVSFMFHMRFLLVHRYGLLEHLWINCMIQRAKAGNRMEYDGMKTFLGNDGETRSDANCNFALSPAESHHKRSPVVEY